jgi:hypothetical protein
MENEHTKEANNKIDINNPTALTDDIKFIRSVIEKTYQIFEPGSLLFIVLGLIFLIGLPATQCLLTIPQLKEFIQPMWLIFWVIGAAVGIFGGFTSEIRQKKSGHVSQLSNQIGFIWYILLLNGTIWSAGMIMPKPFHFAFGNPAFLWAVIFGFGLSVTGILSSKEWLFGGVAIFIAILAAAVLKPYTYVILGIVIGLGCIIPAIFAKRDYNKKEKNYE